MTIVELPSSNGHGHQPTPVPSDDEARRAAREDYRADPSLTGRQLAERYGRSERWGRKQIDAARRDGTAPARHPAVETARSARQEIAAAKASPARAGGTRHDPLVYFIRMGDRVKIGHTNNLERRLRELAVSPEDVVKLVSGGQETEVELHEQWAQYRVWDDREWFYIQGSLAKYLGMVDQRRPFSALVVAAICAVMTVTAVCAVVSYIHIRDLAGVAGMEGLAGWFPIGVDGLVVACTCSLIIDRRHGVTGQPLAWLGVSIGLIGSIAANVLAVIPGFIDPRVVAGVLAGFPPVALAISAHLLLRMLGER